VPDVPSSLPSQLVAGTTWIWDRELADYPQPTWSAIAYFENSQKAFNAAATQNGTAQRFTMAAATTAAIPAGRYAWKIRVTDGSQVFIAEAGSLEVDADPAAAGVRDTRSWARRALEAVEAFLEGNASTAQQSMTVNGRSISRWSLPELTQWRDKLRAEVRSDESTNGSKGRIIKAKLLRG
jgi:hypothetical protein